MAFDDRPINRIVRVTSEKSLEEAAEELNKDGYRVAFVTNVDAPEVNSIALVGERVPVEGAKSIVPNVRYIENDEDDTSVEGSLKLIAKHLKEISGKLPSKASRMIGP